MEEVIKPWFIFGNNPVTGKVDVADASGDVVTQVESSEAEEIVEERRKLINIIYELIKDDYSVYERVCEMYRN